MSNSSTAPSLAEVAEEFTHWRQTRTRPRTPERLQQKAVALLSNHGVSEVMKALGVDHRRLKRWKQQCSAESAPAAPSTPFILLPTPAAPPTPKPQSAPSLETSAVALKLSHQRSDGSVLSIEAELDQAHWRWVVQLLHAPVAS